ncbi:sugar ABC transporter permease [Sinomonas sp. ASV322]|uniref:carbohydrate ABC transporter permease n=1 Tax=Sinomonas sp. ASV322 TaxID=3041920 RepID=UPI0027DD2EB8|nr:sugar ABC transporter permease [Sinomonas sp. ASV322]MDQ4502554.1 sugar ABC transporter permease [Sinomonas sp. ASV322]
MSASATRAELPGATRPGGPRPLNRNRNSNKAHRREAAFGWAMISLSALTILVFTAAPIVFTFVLAFFSWDIISPPEFVGFKNFAKLAGDTAVVHSFGVTAWLAILVVVLQIVIGLAMAILVQQRVSTWARSIFRTAFFLPLLVSAASISIVFSYLFDDHFGVINYYLGLLNLPQVPWLSSPAGATATIVIVAVWQQLGFVFILFTAALGSLPKDVLEAVSIDGSGPIRTFFAIKLPLISPTIFFASVIGLINAMQIFDQPYVMTKGGPGDATTTTVMLIYRTAFQNIQFGYGSAISVVLFVLLLAITGLQFYISRKWVFYS